MPRRRPIVAVQTAAAAGLAVFALGCGSSGSSGESTDAAGLVDAMTNSTDTAVATLDKQIRAAVAKTAATPEDQAAWAQLARLRYQRAGIDAITAEGTYTERGKGTLRLAAQAWERHLALDPKPPDARVARLMVQAYGSSGVGEPDKAVRAMEIVTAAEKPPASNVYAQLAQLAYIAGETRTADLAADRAVELAPRRDRKQLRAALDAIEKQAPAQP